MSYMEGGTTLSGWIKLHRKILDNDIWNDVITFRLFTLLLLRASHKDGIKVKGIDISRGQYLRSYSKLCEDLEYKEGRGYKKVSKSTIKRSVQKLIDNGMVSVSETDIGTVFTILKYHEYQQVEENNESTNRTDSEPLVERSRNDGGTNPEQEQELKNLRIKELNNSTTTDAIVFYQNNFGLISPSISEKILSWINDVGDEMVVEALDRALKRNKVSWGFAEFILKDWHRKGIKSIEQAKAEEIDFQNRQTYKKPFQQKQQAFEIVPDWFKNRKKQSSNPPAQLSPEEQAKEQAEVEALLRQYSSKAGG